jgi:RIO-like serine/threonine protein kinase
LAAKKPNELKEILMSRQDDVKKLINTHSRRLQRLKEQQALAGISVDPKISLEIEDIESEIEKLQAELTKKDSKGEQINNPYIHRGKPIREIQHFYGRQHELAQVANDIRNGQCVSVVGIRRIGKTSLLFQLLNSDTRSAYQLSEETLYVYITCGPLTTLSTGEVYGKIMRKVYQELKKHRQIGLLQPPEETMSYSDFEDSMLGLLEGGLKLVLLLDEFEGLAHNPKLDVSFFLGLRALHTEYEITYVTASQYPLMELAFSDEDIITSPFPNIFDSIRIGLFSESEARELMQAAGVFSFETEDFLLDLTGGHPLALQHAGYYAFELLQETSRPLSQDDLFIVWKQTQEAMESQYRYYWKQLTSEQKRILSAPTYFAARVKDDTLIENLFKDLVTLGLLTKWADGSFSYTGRALADFVRLEQMRDKSLQALSAGNLVGQRLGQYRIIDRLGRGGMADVYKAHHPTLDRDVAIKVMFPHLASDEGFSARFQREARAVAALRHPHIVQIYDFGQENGFYYMVMEYISGKNLKTHLQAVGQMPIDNILQIIRQIGGALHYAHSQGLLHRDVKPANVMLSPSSGAILTDFGLAKIVGGTRFTGSNIIGTAAYMAPEQINEAATVDHRVDIYALGVMFYEMITGQVPFEANTPAAVIFKHLHESLPDPRQLRPDLPDVLVKVIDKALAKEPKQRYQTVQEMLDALEQDS